MCNEKRKEDWSQCDKDRGPKTDNREKEYLDRKTPDPWIHRSTGMVCETCMWFVIKGSPITIDNIRKGRCRRHAPTMNGYPVVFNNDWCGDHKLA